MQCEERHGIDAVEDLLDSCHALMNYGVDRYKRPYPISAEEERLRQKDREEHLQKADQRPVAHHSQTRWQGTATRTMRASPPNPRKTSCISSKNTHRCWNPGSGKSCGSCARLRNIFIHSAKPR